MNCQKNDLDKATTTDEKVSYFDFIMSMFCGVILLLHRTLSSGSIEVSYQLLGIAHHCKTGPAMAGPAGVGATALAL